MGEVVFEEVCGGVPMGLHLKDISLGEAELVVQDSQSKMDQRGKGPCLSCLRRRM